MIVQRVLFGFEKKTVLITGHRGFVGRHLLNAVTNEACDSRTPTEVFGIDLRDGEDICNAYLPDADRVYHLAAVTDAQSNDDRLIYEVNVRASIRLFVRYGPKLVFASSSMVAYRETSPYAMSKFLAEDKALTYSCAVVRLCNLFGPGGHSAVDKFRDGPEIVVRGSGEQVRTYAHVGHAVRAMLQVEPGELKVLEGQDQTVNQLAAMYSWNKPVRHEPAHYLDLMDGRQVLPSAK